MSGGFLYEDLPPVLEGRTVWYGTVASEPASFDEKIYVIIPEFDNVHRWGPCFWQSRGSNLTWEFTTDYEPDAEGEIRDHDVLPVRGNPCLVIFDNRRQPWVVAWWPYGS